MASEADVTKYPSDGNSKKFGFLSVLKFSHVPFVITVSKPTKRDTSGKIVKEHDIFVGNLSLYTTEGEHRSRL